MAIIRITDLSLRTIIGMNDWERKTRQDILINVDIHYDARKAAESDNILDTVDYKAITKKIIARIEDSQFLLLEKMADVILGIVMEEPKVRSAIVRIDKPGALRFARSVSVEMEAKRS